MKKLLSVLSLSLLLAGCASSGGKTAIEVAKGDEFLVEELLSYKIIGLEITDVIEPSSTVGYYSYYEPESNDNVFLDLSMEVTNESSSAIELPDFMEGIFIVNDMEYDAKIITEEDDGTGLWAYEDIAPLDNAKAHLYFEIAEDKIPEEVSLKLTINSDESLLSLNVTELAPTKLTLSYGDIIEKEDYCSLNIVEILKTKEIRPSSPTDSWYSYYEVDDADNSYLALKMKLTNLYTSSLDPDDVIGCKAIVDDKYEYKGFIVCEEDNGADISGYAQIDPLDEEIVYCLIEISDSLLDRDIQIKLNVFGQNYYIQTQ